MQQVPKTLTIAGVSVPSFLYGTAWKEEATKGLVLQALEAGFRGIDTANQRRHYYEEGVGQALAETFAGGWISRKELFIQTKFTYPGGQDHRLPYDLDAEPRKQVRQSLESSLKHLGVETIDSYLLHGPETRSGLTPTDLEVWRAMEELHAEGLTRLIGVSNMTRAQLELLCDQATTPPAFIQNRCYARTGWDRRVRHLCAERGVVYQGFSLLTANQRELHHPDFQHMLVQTGRTPAQLVFGFALQVGMLPLTGTTNPKHMLEDLAVYELPPLSEEDVELLGELEAH